MVVFTKKNDTSQLCPVHSNRKNALDTIVISQTVKPIPLAAVATWWQKQSLEDLYLSSLTIHELRYGFELLPLGSRRREFEGWLVELVLPRFQGRILPVDVAVADRGGRLLAAAKGSAVEVADALIAATAVIHEMPIATLNRKDFQHLGVELVNF